MYAIETEKLTKIYRGRRPMRSAPSLDSLDLVVGEHEVFGFLGKNGAGKTTTIKILCGLLRPSRGKASVFGVPVNKRAARKLLGYLPEDPYFYEYLTPEETLDFYGRIEGLTAQQRKKEWGKLSELLDLRDIADLRIRNFSKGMRQRLGFAVALVGDPDLLILDEPMSGLDPLGRRSIRDLILMMREEKKTIFFSSHVLGDVEQICDRIGILVEGKLTVQGRLDELLTRQIDQVEIIAAGLAETTVNEIRDKSANARVSEAGNHFYVNDPNLANEVVKIIHAEGGTLIEYNPIKESLEDYFIREQET